MTNLSFSVPSTLLVLVILILPLTFPQNGELVRVAEGGKGRVHIPDDLDEVVDDEEDESWKQWGKKKTPEFDPPPDDFSNMELSQIQEEMMKRQFGPVFGFVKLRLGVRRTPDMVAEIAMKWSNVVKTGGMETRFMAVDTSTIMFTMERGQDSLELKEFLLSQPEAYEIKIGDNVFRRPGDPSVDEVVQKLHNERNNADNVIPSEDSENSKDEL